MDAPSPSYGKADGIGGRPDWFVPYGVDDEVRPAVARKGLIESPNTLATVAHAIMRDRFGDEWYWWDPLTVEMELRDEYGAEPSPQFMDRLHAVQVLMTGDAFFNRIDAFMGVCNAFSSGDPFFGTFDPVTAEEAAWGVAEAGMNRDMLEFSPTIRTYCRIVLSENGYGDDDVPPVFDAVFGGRAGISGASPGLVSEENGAELRGFVLEQVNDLVEQLKSVPDMKGLDMAILKNGVVSAISDRRRG